MKQCQSKRRCYGRAFTLIELLVVVSIIALLIAILLPSLTRAREQARSTKCLANLHAITLATVTYSTDQGDFLPGPLHPAIVRDAHSIGELGDDHGSLTDLDKQKTLIWLLRPYFQSGGTFRQESIVADEVSKCPTAAIVAPDKGWPTGGALARPFSYSINSYGPLRCPLNEPGGTEWYHTDPPFYFGCWFYTDKWPETPGIWWNVYQKRMWKPKPISRIKFASAEWDFGDAWYRQIPTPGQVPGMPRARRYLGSFPSPGSGPLLPSTPYHGVKAYVAKVLGSGDHPKIEFKGWTNLGFFDGHAAATRGHWRRNGAGGTVNPYWRMWGGKRTKYTCP